MSQSVIESKVGMSAASESEPEESSDPESSELKFTHLNILAIKIGLFPDFLFYVGSTSPGAVFLLFFFLRECSGSVVECLTRDREAEGLSLTGVSSLWSLSKTHLS